MNYYNDSLENDPNFGLNDENEEDEENDEEKKENNTEDKKEETGIDEIIEIKKDSKNPNENPKEKNENEISTKKEEKENNDDKKEEEKTIKVLYKNEDNINNDKTSYCHIIFHKGEDIDVSMKKIFECYEEISNRNFLLFKKRVKIKTLLFFEEQYIYILRDKIVDNDNQKLRRISNILDLNKLFDYKVSKKENNYLFTLDFLKEDNLLERNLKNLLFDENVGEEFEDYLIKMLEKIDATFLDEIFEQNEEDDEDEKDKEKENSNEKENNEKNENEDKDNEKDKEKIEENKNNPKVYKRVILQGDDLNIKLSSSREIFK
jgi:hypothetical protein